jgi:hypothetical protein
MIKNDVDLMKNINLNFSYTSFIIIITSSLDQVSFATFTLLKCAA